MSATTSRNNLDVSHPSLQDTNRQALCHLVTLFPFAVEEEGEVDNDNDSNSNTNFIMSGYESAFATYLAIQHLNQADGSIIPQVTQIGSSSSSSGNLPTCPIHFSIEYLNTHYHAGRALHALMQRLIVEKYDNGGGEDDDDSENDDNDTISTQPPQPQPLPPNPCAFLGAYRSSISESTATLTSFQGYPQLSGMSTSSDLNDRLSFPLFGRTIPSDAGTAKVVAMHYASLGISHLAVIATNDSFGNAYASELRKAIARLNIDITLQQIPVEKDGSNIAQAVSSVKALQYRYVFVAHFGGVNMALNDALMLEAYQQGLIDGPHVWMFSDGIASALASKILPRNSPLYHAYRGVGSIEASGGLPGNSQYDLFAEQLLQLKQEFLESTTHPLRQLLPYYHHHDRQEEEQSSALMDLLQDEAFLNPLADGRVPMIYEAAIMLGVAACQAATYVTIDEDEDDEDSSSSSSTFLHLDGQRFFDTLVNNVTLDGMSGLVTLDPQTGSRVANSTLFRLVNMVVQEDDDNNGDSDMVQLTPVDSRLFTEGRWQTLQPYVYNDGTTRQPLDIPPAELEPNHIDPYIRGISLTFAVLAIGLAVYLLAWTFYKRNTRIVRASQPMFLYLVCVGSILLGTCALYRQTVVDCLRLPLY
jgi:Receptor family ligand binding region